MQYDLAQVRPDEWVAHYNQSDFEGIWSGVALRSIDGTTADLLVRPVPYHDTPLLSRCPYFREVLEKLRYRITAARLLRLHPGSIIKEHCDPALGFEDGEIRLHIPIQTSPDVYFFLEGRRVILCEGETWYLDLSRRHRIENRGSSNRVHLVIDGIVNDWVRVLFETTEPIPAPETLTPFDQFREIVFTDRDLQQKLLSTQDRRAFILMAVTLGNQRSFAFDADHVESALRRGRESWNRRWENA